MEQVLVEKKVLAASERLSVAQEQLDAAMQGPGGSRPDVEAMKEVSERLREARACIEQLQQHIESTAEAVPSMRHCPACGASIRAKATLCGHCWTKVSPTL
ncbi:hypothetical protein [Sorangium cellulosum]|uniref:Zinc ribbon domain-containing protein n=1 Tax=Sorangium cellulosum TaxID=56 RepID=A0A150Q4V6_SORCE|nr:hypothetical protein [Sorangium cellulosum]KYF62999.1 hypothetical protein BE15_04130 [Sorangium cellulosum]